MRSKNSWFVIFLASLALTALSVIGLTIYLGFKNVDQYKDLGPWGDFVGGLLNPTLTFLTFIGLLFTIFLQRVEISLTRDEMKRSADALELQEKTSRKQNFENTYFGMVNLHNSIVNSIDLVHPATKSITNGRDCFRSFYTSFSKEYREIKQKSKDGSESELLRVSYEKFWRTHQLDLGHYMRYLFNIIRFIDQSELSERHHMKLVRSLLSDQELLILFYNSTQERGRKFKELAEKHALFDNLPIIRLLDPSHAAMVGKSAFGDNAEAV